LAARKSENLFYGYAKYEDGKWVILTCRIGRYYREKIYCKVSYCQKKHCFCRFCTGNFPCS